MGSLVDWQATADQLTTNRQWFPAGWAKRPLWR